MRAFLKEYWHWLLIYILAFFLGVGIAAFSDKAAAAERWVILGDGVSTVVVENGQMADPATVAANRLQQVMGFPVENRPVGGSWALNPQLLKSAIASLAGTGTTGVILAFGVNDWSTGQNLQRMGFEIMSRIKELKALGIVRVVCLTPLHRSGEDKRHGPNPGQVTAYGNPLITNPGNPGVLSYSRWIASVCSANGAGTIDGHPFHLPFAYYGNNPMNGQLQLNGLGHEWLAQHIREQLQMKGYWP